jgi:hypothetical protein
MPKNQEPLRIFDSRRSSRNPVFPLVEWSDLLYTELQAKVRDFYENHPYPE